MRYITGISALNIPYKGKVADWHNSELFKNKNFAIHSVNFTGAINLFDYDGIFNATDYFRKRGFTIDTNKVVYVATPLRVVLDMLYNYIVMKNLTPNHFNLQEFLLDDMIDKEELLILLDYFLKQLENSKQKALLKKWRKKNGV